MKIPAFKILVNGKYESVPAIKGGDGYTPVKGKDYLTESDIAELKEEIISGLPDYNPTPGGGSSESGGSGNAGIFTTDTYTKNEIDDKLNNKVDKVRDYYLAAPARQYNTNTKKDNPCISFAYGEEDDAVETIVIPAYMSDLINDLDVNGTPSTPEGDYGQPETLLTSENEQPVYGEELINTAVWTLGEGWSGDASSGFTHAKTGTTGYGESLTCNIGNTEDKLYEIQFSSSVKFTSTNVLISIGNSDYAQLYGQGETTSLGIRSVSNGVVEFKVENTYTGTLTITSIRQITGASTPTNVIKDSTEKITAEYRYRDNTKHSLFIGRGSGQYNSFGYNNVGIGYDSLSDNVSGFWNVGIGYSALQGNTAGSRNIGIGHVALQQNTVGCRNIAIGSFALKSNTSGSWNIAIGADSMDHNTTGEKNTAVGFSTLYNNTTGKQNAAFGANALVALTTGNNNVGVGVGAGSGIKTGSGNMAVGYGALSYIDSGSNNVAIGSNALYRCKGGEQNVAIGQGAGMGATGNSMKRNVFIGANTAKILSGAAEKNVVLGYNSAQYLVEGDGNIILGAYCEVGESISNALNIGNLITGNMATESKSVTIDGTLTINNIPTSDPNVAGQIWNDNGTLKVSAGV